MSVIKNGVITTGSGSSLAADAIKSSKYDESTAYPIKSADSGSTEIARTGADSDTLESLSDQLDTITSSVARIRVTMDFWSTPQEEVQLTTTAADKSLPDVVVAGIPAGATVTRAIAIFKFRAVENTNASANSLNGAQEIQVRDDTPGSWADCINFVDDQFSVAANTREGGDIVVGAIDVSSTVDGNDTYNFQWDEADANQNNLQFNGVQIGLIITYSI